MPEQLPIPVLDLAELEQKSLDALMGAWEDNVALSTVRETFFKYSVVRANNHERRWTDADRLYFGWVPQRVWEGTTIPRSSWSSQLVFDQVEAALSIILQALFGNPEWFQTEPEAGTTPEQAKEAQAYLSYLLDCSPEDGVTTFYDLAELAIKQVLLYGNGGMFVEWDSQKNKPTVSWVDIRDIYVDPGCPTPNTEHARSLIRRSKKTVEEILGWKGNPDIKLPPEGVLYAMANGYQYDQADTGKAIQASIMGQQFTPGDTDRLPLPTDKQIEVLSYYSKDRIILVLNRSFVCYNQPNPYGVYPFAFAPCYAVAGKWEASSLADNQERNQRLSDALWNGHMDEIALALNPPKVQKASALLTPAQQRWRPGGSIKASNPKEDVIFPAVQQTTMNVSAEVDFLERSAEKRTGVSGLSSGTPRPGNANRTLGGMQLQSEGSNSRLYTIIKHVENYLIVPVLQKMLLMTSIHNEDTFLPGAVEGQNTVVQAASLDKKVKFKVLGASKMMTKEKLSGVVPVLYQYLAQGPLVAELSKSQQKINWPVLMEMIQDAAGTAKMYPLVVPMSQEEVQALNQPSPDQMMAAQEKQMDQQTRLQIQEMKGQQDIQKELIKGQPNPMEMEMERMKAEMEMAKAQMDIEIQRIKLELEKQKAQLKLQIEEAKMQQSVRKAQVDEQVQVQKANTQMATQQMQAEMQLNQQAQVNEQTLRQSEESHKQGLSQMSEKAETKDSIKEKGASKQASKSNRGN